MLQKSYEVVTEVGYGDWEELIYNRYSHTHCECPKLHHLLTPPLQRCESLLWTLACWVVRFQMILSGANLRHHFILGCNRVCLLIFFMNSAVVYTDSFSVTNVIQYICHILVFWVGEVGGSDFITSSLQNFEVVVESVPFWFDPWNSHLNSHWQGEIPSAQSVIFRKASRLASQVQRPWLIFGWMWRSAKIVVRER